MHRSSVEWNPSHQMGIWSCQGIGTAGRSFSSCDFSSKAEKSSYFANTDLDYQLRQRDITHLVFAGMAANTCLESTNQVFQRVISVFTKAICRCWELGTANQSDRLGDHVIRGRNDLSAKSTCT